MSDMADASWLATVRVDRTLLRNATLLRTDELSEFAADLVAVYAGTRTSGVVLAELLKARQYDRAASCVLGADEEARPALEEHLRRAWGETRGAWMRRLEDARAVQREAEAVAPTFEEVARALVDLRDGCGALEKQLDVCPTWNATTLFDDLKTFSAPRAQDILDQVEFVDLAARVLEEALSRAERDRVEKLKKLKLRGDDFVTELTLRSDIPDNVRASIMPLHSRMLAALSERNLAALGAAVDGLEALTRGELPAELPPVQPAPSPRASVPPPRGVARSVFEEASLTRWSQVEVLADLKASKPRGEGAEALWPELVREWSPEVIDELLQKTHTLLRGEALGAQLILRGRKTLQAGEHERAYWFFLDALRWSLSDDASDLPLVRYQDGAAWGLLHAITMSARAERWGPARFDTESRDLRDVVQRVENLGLLANVAEVLLDLRAHGVTYFERWLSPLLVERRSALRALVMGMVDTFPLDPLWLWRLLVAVLKTELPRLEAGDDAPFMRAAPKTSSAFRTWRAEQLDALKGRLQAHRDESAIADEAIRALEHVAQRLERGARDQESGVALALLTPEVAAARRSCVVLRLTLSDERRAGLRGLRVDARVDLDGRGPTEKVTVPWLPKDTPVEVAIPVSSDAPTAASLQVSLLEFAPDGTRVPMPTKVSSFALTFTSPYAPRSNPYILKDAVHDASLVYGRERDIQKVLATLHGEHQLNPVLVLGARRIGKTSFLNAVCAQERIKERFDVVRIDFQSVTAAESVEVFFLTRMMRGIQEPLHRRGMFVPIKEQALRENPHTAFANFVEAVDQRLRTAERPLLLVIDEMEKVASAARVDEEGRPQSVGEEVLASLRAAMQRSRRIGFLLAGATDGIRRYQRTYHARLFQLAEEIELPPLDDDSARALIERQSAPYLQWRASAVEVVLREAAGDPSLIQLIGFRVFEALKERCARTVTSYDVRAEIDRLVEDPKDFWAFFESLDDAVDRTIVRVIAELQADPVRRERESARERSWVRRRWIADELRRRGQAMDDGALLERLERLCREVSNVLTRNPVQPQRDFRITAGLFAQHLVARPARVRV